MQKALKGFRTKRKLADALKEQLNAKPLEKVRIHELTEQCDIHRQTFYYHFDDIYDLFTWCMQQDAEMLSARLTQVPSWQDSLRGLLEYAAENRGYFMAGLAHIPPAKRQSLWAKVLAAVLKKFPSAYPAGQERGAEPQAYWKSISVMLSTLLEKWVRGELGQSPDEVIRFLEALSDCKAPA